MEIFDEAVEYVLENEGGYGWDPADSGGPTNYGITQSDLAAWRGTAVTPQDVQNMLVSEAKAIYEARYWTPMGCDKMTQAAIATAVMDTGVLYGPGTSGRYAQEAANATGASLAVDGEIGPLTIAALNAISPKAFIQAFVGCIEARIKAIVANNPQDAKFQAGWQNRANRLFTLA